MRGAGGLVGLHCLEGWRRGGAELGARLARLTGDDELGEALIEGGCWESLVVVAAVACGGAGGVEDAWAVHEQLVEMLAARLDQLAAAAGQDTELDGLLEVGTAGEGLDGSVGGLEQHEPGLPAVGEYAVGEYAVGEYHDLGVSKLCPRAAEIFTCPCQGWQNMMRRKA
jgi:hypothetical protein